MTPALREHIAHLVKIYHEVDEESERTGEGWDAVLAKRGLDACAGYHALSELSAVYSRERKQLLDQLAETTDHLEDWYESHGSPVHSTELVLLDSKKLLKVLDPQR